MVLGRAAGVSRVALPSQAEVADLGPVGAVEQDVARLDVTMDDGGIGSVQERETISGVDSDAGPSERGQRLSLRAAAAAAAGVELAVQRRDAQLRHDAEAVA